MTSNYEDGLFNGKTDPAKRPKAKKPAHTPTRAANTDNIGARLDALMDEAVRKYRAKQRQGTAIR